MCLCRDHTANNDKLNIFYVIYLCFLIDIIIQMSSTLWTNLSAQIITIQAKYCYTILNTTVVTCYILLLLHNCHELLEFKLQVPRQQARKKKTNESP